jgi:hypothetical protein
MMLPVIHNLCWRCVTAAEGSIAGVLEASEEDELQVGQPVSNRVRRVNRNVMGPEWVSE